MKALEDQNYQVIKSAVLEGKESSLPARQQVILDRWISASKLLEKNPVTKNAVAILQAKYPKLSRTQAYEDCRNATRMFCTKANFDFDRWHTWLLNDIVNLCEKAKSTGDLKAWALAQRNLIKALGDAPTQDLDPRLMENNQVTLNIQVNNNHYTKEFNKFLEMDIKDRTQITDALIIPASDDEITEIMES